MYHLLFDIVRDNYHRLDTDRTTIMCECLIAYICNSADQEKIGGYNITLQSRLN